MENIILSPISLESLESLIQKSVAAAIKSNKLSDAITEQSDELTIGELATYLRCTKATIHTYKKRGIFPYYQTGRTVYFKKLEVDAALEINNRGGRKYAK